MGNEFKINRSVKIVGNNLIITKAYAEKNLSSNALALAERVSTHYSWVLGKTSAVVFFELPKLFEANFYSILPMLTNYCMSYVKAMGLNDNVIYSKFLDNYNKKIQG